MVACERLDDADSRQRTHAVAVDERGRRRTVEVDAGDAHRSSVLSTRTRNQVRVWPGVLYARRAMAARPEPLRPPLQIRSRAALERVLDAGEELLIEKGWDGFTVQEVSRRAGVSIGSIYARAPSKEALIFAVYDRTIGRVAAENAAGLAPDSHWDGMTPREVIEGAVHELGRQTLRNEPFLRVVMNRSPVDPVLRERADEQIRLLSTRWHALLTRHKDAIAHRNPSVAIEMAFRIVFATLARRIAQGPDFGSTKHIADDRMLDEL